MSEPDTDADAARAGGCCSCRPGCAGIDAQPPDIECDPWCAWCMHGCPAPADEPCTCALGLEGAP